MFILETPPLTHHHHKTKTKSIGPTEQVDAINEAIGAQSAFALQCKSMVRDYLPNLIKAIRDLPLDQVRVF